MSKNLEILGYKDVDTFKDLIDLIDDDNEDDTLDEIKSCLVLAYQEGMNSGGIQELIKDVFSQLESDALAEEIKREDENFTFKYDPKTLVDMYKISMDEFYDTPTPEGVVEEYTYKNFRFHSQDDYYEFDEDAFLDDFDNQLGMMASQEEQRQEKEMKKLYGDKPIYDYKVDEE